MRDDDGAIVERRGGKHCVVYHDDATDKVGTLLREWVLDRKGRDRRGACSITRGRGVYFEYHVGDEKNIRV